MTEIGKQIIALDRQRMAAMTRKDTATLNALLSDDLVYTHAMGRIDTKQGLIADIKSRSVVFETMEPFDVKAQDFGNVVVLTGLTGAWRCPRRKTLRNFHPVYRCLGQ